MLFFTAFYSTRLIYLVFLSIPNTSKITILNSHEASWRMALPLFLLTILTVLIGFTAKDMFIGFGTSFWGSAIFILPKNYTIVDIEFISYFYKILPLYLTLLGIFCGFGIYAFGMHEFFQIKKLRSFKAFYNFFNKKWYVDKLYNQYLVSSMLYYSYHFSYKNVDRGMLEFMGPKGITNNVKHTFLNIKDFQSGDLFRYFFYFFLSILIFLLFILLK